MYLNSAELSKIGFKELGSNLQISSKAQFHNPHLMSLGSNVRIDDFVVVSGNVEIGSYVHLSIHSALISPRASIIVGDFVTISFHTCVTSASDDFSGQFLTNPTVPSELTNVQDSTVVIEQHAIIGAHSLVMPGVNLREACAIGAFSLVKDEVPSGTVYAGVPAKKIGLRSRKLLNLVREI
jgi:galactoside O-acetyltransferase